MSAGRVARPITAEAGLDPGASLLLVLLCAIWGLNQVAVKVAQAGISSVTQLGLRSLVAALLVLAYAWLRDIPLARRDGTLVAGLVAGLLFAVEFVLIYWGLARTTVARSVLFIYTTPFFVAVGAHYLLPGDRLTRVKLAGLALAFVGVVIAFADALRLPSARELTGDVMCLAAAVLWAATTLVIKGSALATARPEKTLLYQLGVSAIVLLPFAALLGEPGIFAPTPLVLAAMGYQIVVVAFASYVTWFWLVANYPASRLAAFTFLTPIFGLAFGAVLLDELVSRGLLLAVLLIAAGIYLVNRPASTS
jgi:drug/metabolite transporter (DMT)-like permease